ncbi:MAG: hypothetical protein K2K57_04635 [Oscillospiraceae bacterium]|nr:hypothetical protein [Oscillospiraceae bacterium]
MPFINVKTNENVSADKAEVIKSELGRVISIIPGKSESWLMVNIEGDCALYFKGTSESAAIAQVQLYGGASSECLSELTGEITGILGNALGIPAGRVYVSYMLTENWGWNGSNF